MKVSKEVNFGQKNIFDLVMSMVQIQMYILTNPCCFANFETWHKYVSVHSQSNMAMFCLKKLISQPRVVEKSPFLAWRTLTHNILMSVIFRSHLTPPICLKMPICAIFSTFWESHLKHTPKVGVHREKFNIGNVAQNFFGGFYICWDYVISFSQHFPMKNFSPSPSTSPSPESHELFEFWLLVGN